MGIKSRPGWNMGVCIGYCKLKANCPSQCINKSKYEDCRIDCTNKGTLCDDCHNAEHYREKS